MSEDIVAKLRDMHALAADSCDPQFSAVLLEAADEIDRLRAEVLRLREALQTIADWCPATCEITLAHDMADTAIAALGKAEG